MLRRETVQDIELVELIEGEIAKLSPRAKSRRRS
jgi:hypothetical protein